MSLQDIRGVYFMRNKGELIGAEYAILESSSFLVCFPMKLSESARLSASYGRVPLHAFMAWMNFAPPADKALKIALIGKDCQPIFSSAIP